MYQEIDFLKTSTAGFNSLTVSCFDTASCLELGLKNELMLMNCRKIRSHNAREVF